MTELVQLLSYFSLLPVTQDLLNTFTFYVDNWNTSNIHPPIINTLLFLTPCCGGLPEPLPAVFGRRQVTLIHCKTPQRIQEDRAVSTGTRDLLTLQLVWWKFSHGRIRNGWNQWKGLGPHSSTNLVRTWTQNLPVTGDSHTEQLNLFSTYY